MWPPTMSLGRPARWHKTRPLKDWKIKQKRRTPGNMSLHVAIDTSIFTYHWIEHTAINLGNIHTIGRTLPISRSGIVLVAKSVLLDSCRCSKRVACETECQLTITQSQLPLTLLIITVTWHDTAIDTAENDIGCQAVATFTKEAASVGACKVCKRIGAARSSCPCDINSWSS